MPQNKAGHTAAIIAAFYGKDECLKIIIDAKADLDVKVRREGGGRWGEWIVRLDPFDAYTVVVFVFKRGKLGHVF